MDLNELNSIPAQTLEEVYQYVVNQKATYKSKEATAKMLGISAGMMYAVLNKEWEKIAKDTLLTLAAKAGSTGISDWQIVETVNYQKVMGACKAAQHLSGMFALLGETGTGKTVAASHISKRLQNVFYVLADMKMTQTAFLDAILTAMGVRAYNYRGCSAKVNAICQTLSRATKPLLVVDDAGKLSSSVLALIQIIYDHTRGKAGILLVGTETLWEAVKKHAENNKYHMREFYGRIGHWDLLGYPTHSDIEKIAVSNGVADSTAITWLANATCSLHTLESMIKKAIEVGKAMSKPITGEILGKMNQKFRWHDKQFMNFEQRVAQRSR